MGKKSRTRDKYQENRGVQQPSSQQPKRADKLAPIYRDRWPTNRMVQEFQVLGLAHSVNWIGHKSTDRPSMGGAFWKMKEIFRSKSVSIKLKTQLFEAACVSILLYGCESWIINQKLNNALNSFATNCYRIMLGIKRIDKVSNEIVYKMVGRNSLTFQVQERQLRFVGHCLRRNVFFPFWPV